MDAVKPDLIERATGGWLAVAPRDSSLHIAVTAPTREDAVMLFATEWAEWQKLLKRAREKES